jgi:hypothetical protein
VPILATRVPLRLLALVVACAACAPAPTPTPDAGPDAGAPDPYLPASTYCEELAPFFCPFYLRCGRLAAADEAECLELFAASCEAGFEPGYVQLEAAGLMRFSRAGLEACEAHLEDVPCALHPRDLDGPCAGLWEGQQGEGEACGFNLESLVCAPGHECALSLDLCGECRPIVDDGRVPLLEACGADDRCVRGASCIDGACQGPSYVGLGEPCDNQNRCPFNADCAEGFCSLNNEPPPPPSPSPSACFD